MWRGTRNTTLTTTMNRLRVLDRREWPKSHEHWQGGLGASVAAGSCYGCSSSSGSGSLITSQNQPKSLNSSSLIYATQPQEHVASLVQKRVLSTSKPTSPSNSNSPASRGSGTTESSDKLRKYLLRSALKSDDTLKPTKPTKTKAKANAKDSDLQYQDRDRDVLPPPLHRHAPSHSNSNASSYSYYYAPPNSHSNAPVQQPSWRRQTAYRQARYGPVGGTSSSSAGGGRTMRNHRSNRSSPPSASMPLFRPATLPPLPPLQNGFENFGYNSYNNHEYNYSNNGNNYYSPQYDPKVHVGRFSQGEQQEQQDLVQNWRQNRPTSMNGTSRPRGVNGQQQPQPSRHALPSLGRLAPPTGRDRLRWEQPASDVPNTSSNSHSVTDGMHGHEVHYQQQRQQQYQQTPYNNPSTTLDNPQHQHQTQLYPPNSTLYTLPVVSFHAAKSIDIDAALLHVFGCPSGGEGHDTAAMSVPTANANASANANADANANASHGHVEEHENEKTNGWMEAVVAYIFKDKDNPTTKSKSNSKNKSKSKHHPKKQDKSTQQTTSINTRFQQQQQRVVQYQYSRTGVTIELAPPPSSHSTPHDHSTPHNHSHNQNHTPSSYVTLFQFGAVAFINVPPSDMQALLQSIKQYATHPMGVGKEGVEEYELTLVVPPPPPSPLPQPQSQQAVAAAGGGGGGGAEETLHMDSHTPNQPQPQPQTILQITSDTITTNTLTLNTAQTLSTVMGQTVALDSYNHTVDDLLQSFSTINHLVQSTGQVSPLERQALCQVVASNNALFINVIEQLGLHDAPSKDNALTWNFDLCHVWHERLEEEFALKVRFEHMEYKMNLIQENAKFFLDVLHNQKTNFLEWVIIGLISLECVLMLLEMSGLGGQVLMGLGFGGGGSGDIGGGGGLLASSSALSDGLNSSVVADASTNVSTPADATIIDGAGDLDGNKNASS